MNRTMKMLSQVGFIVLMGVSLVSEAAARKPNVILVMADDMGLECLSVYGGAPYKTPHLDRMAKQGVLFTDAYSNAMCTPTRVKLMSGRYNFRNYEMFAYMNPDIYTIGNLMKDAGYATAIIGKHQLNGYGKYAVPMEERWPRFKKNGFDEFCMWNAKLDFNTTPDQYHKPVIEQNGQVLRYDGELKGRFGPDVLMEYACDFIHRKKAEPFFVYYPMMLPHAPFIPTPDSEDPNCTDRDKNQQDMVAYVDKLMGRLLAHLEAEGVLDNTLVLFCGDNGTYHRINRSLNGRKLTTGKMYLTDDGTRAILLAYWKGGMKGGQVCGDLIDFSDFMPTLADVAGVAPPADTDGVSFLPQIKGEKGTPREWILVEHDPGMAPQYDYLGRWVRNHTHKLYQDGRVYNSKVDPDETNDLAQSTDPEDRAAIELLTAAMNTLPAWNPKTPKEDAKSRRLARQKAEREKKKQAQQSKQNEDVK
ncbi:sulfatase-like hydrolase/transferase [Pontiella agarivorans]|uniref:Sulfatase-like hydrolase/transferase n=1 Tax=Pontiella agarivorans TaxID=3038953 RepID=A0ABU5MY45_9BACT|nr:sulfatase-like hydrolase/transferase [Pontiella agarivorans]MDZ8119105.1 sulfatase-like hydrolase/transferase [Pontiella agarivorans]